MTITTLSAAINARYVSSLKSLWPGVSMSDMRRPCSSNSSAADVIEMPRSCSSSIQSDVACRRALRPRTAPASSIAPAYSSSFSVRVVLPASGCEMIANVRRLDTSRSSSVSSADTCSITFDCTGSSTDSAYQG